jgi:hypothetical protein
MESRRWLNPSQPQTLQIAVFLLYFNAVSLVIFGGGSYTILEGLGIAAGNVAGGFGIANEQKWGYGLGIGMALVPFLFSLARYGEFYVFGLISLMFDIALIALLLHPQSRDYQRIWFK